MRKQEPKERLIQFNVFKVVEFATPDELINKPGGVFADMMRSVQRDQEGEKEKQEEK